MEPRPGWSEDRSERWEKERPLNITYPGDHQVGMRVPKGGSDCAKCEYVRANGKHCANKYFQKWNGSNVLPAPASEYCCDFFEAK